MGKKHHDKKKKKNIETHESYLQRQETAFYEKFDNIRAFNKEFNDLITEIDSKINKFISDKNAAAFRPKRAINCFLKAKVNAVPITADQKDCIIEYIERKYIPSVAGNYIIFKKCAFTKQYLIISTDTKIQYDYDSCF